jgi:hypothetical protein
VAVRVLTAPSLAVAWPDLDRFEGPGYERILVPVFGTGPGRGQAGERRLYKVANLYAAAEAGPGGQPQTSHVSRPRSAERRKSGSSRSQPHHYSSPRRRRLTRCSVAR